MLIYSSLDNGILELVDYFQVVQVGSRLLPICWRTLEGNINVASNSFDVDLS
jgi:hypothetical protein